MTNGYFDPQTLSFAEISPSAIFASVSINGRNATESDRALFDSKKPRHFHMLPSTVSTALHDGAVLHLSGDFVTHTILHLILAPRSDLAEARLFQKSSISGV
jgi:hypothetical protein